MIAYFCTMLQPQYCAVAILVLPQMASRKPSYTEHKSHLFTFSNPQAARWLLLKPKRTFALQVGGASSIGFLEAIWFYCGWHRQAEAWRALQQLAQARRTTTKTKHSWRASQLQRASPGRASSNQWPASARLSSRFSPISATSAASWSHSNTSAKSTYSCREPF